MSEQNAFALTRADIVPVPSHGICVPPQSELTVSTLFSTASVTSARRDFPIPLWSERPTLKNSALSKVKTILPGSLMEWIVILKRLQLVAEVVFEVPFLRRVKGDFEADEKVAQVALVLLEMIHGVRMDGGIKADEAFLMRIAG